MDPELTYPQEFTAGLVGTTQGLEKKSRQVSILKMRSNLTKSPKEVSEESIRKSSVPRGVIKTGISSPRNNRIAVLNQDDESFQLDKLSFTDGMTPKPAHQAKRKSLGIANATGH